jgi:hypothetical protein
MADQPAPPSDARRILGQARRDRAAAAEAIARLPLESQVALVCEAPLAQRAALLDLVPEPERVIPVIPDAELCFTVKAIGIHDAPWILEYATVEQVVACVDLDAWDGDKPDRATMDAWLDVLAETSEESFLRSVCALDPEILVLYLRSRVEIQLKPNDDDWTPPEGAQTLDGQFYFMARRSDDDITALVTMLRQLFQKDYWRYFRMMQGAIWELDTECEEWALRWRTGRIEDLGFPPWDEAVQIYRYLRPEEQATIPEDASALDVDAWRLPVWMPGLPVAADDAPLVFRAIAQLEDAERTAAFYAFVSLANKLAVADRMSLADAESLPRAIEKAADLTSEGLSFVATETGIDAADVLRRVSLERLFRVGANRLPDRARP